MEKQKSATGALLSETRQYKAVVEDSADQGLGDSDAQVISSRTLATAVVGSCGPPSGSASAPEGLPVLRQSRTPRIGREAPAGPARSGGEDNREKNDRISTW
ncbi:hypothetical protein HPB47_005806 [Ixodes persulcatus]|uniref:Uncharacterized protein n=1 Tax=Ixodes persulcatus TaxID=34615 RepID=A0AC60PCW4_IXOPE|nr:hypothetical protein HPB47_005806 [Ixodes persulcatus]